MRRTKASREMIITIIIIGSTGSSCRGVRVGHSVDSVDGCVAPVETVGVGLTREDGETETEGSTARNGVVAVNLVVTGGKEAVVFEDVAIVCDWPEIDDVEAGPPRSLAGASRRRLAKLPPLERGAGCSRKGVTWGVL